MEQFTPGPYEDKEPPVFALPSVTDSILHIVTERPLKIKQIKMLTK